MLNTHDFYRHPEVIKRMLEYLGVPNSATQNLIIDYHDHLSNSKNLKDTCQLSTAEYLSGWGERLLRERGKKASSRKPHELGELLDKDLNVFRSLWDKQRVFLILDVEYYSHRYPAESYLNQEATFNKLEPVYWALWDIFGEYGIKPLTLVTGQGYHFAFQAESYDKPHFDSSARTTETANKLVDIGFIEETAKGKGYFPHNSKRDRVVEADLGRAFDGVGKLLEFVVHRALQRLPRYGLKVPAGIGDLVHGNMMNEGINLDLSAYAEPIDTRVTRMAFSIHNKHHDPTKDIGARHIPVQITIPRYTPCNGNMLSLGEVFNNRRHFMNAANYASSINTNIPDCSEGVLKLIDHYKNSNLYQFHKYFDSSWQENPKDWHWTYDSFDLREVPPCVAHAIANPNPRLLQPSQIQTLARVLTGKGWWHPIDVAGLIRSKYERGYGWDFNWGRYDANRHARVWTRYYSGLLADGLDHRTDQNCVSHQEKGMCIVPYCGYNIGDYR